MRISKLSMIISTLFMSINSSAQYDIVVNKSDSIKCLEHKVYKVKTKNNIIIKSSPKKLDSEFYPLASLYPQITNCFNKKGDLIKKVNSYQKDTSYYNSDNKKIKRVLYQGRLKDSITISYTYDIQGNIETEKMRASAPKLDYELDGNYYSYESLTDKFYRNYYITENDSTGKYKFESIKMALNYYYRLYNNQSKLIKEKYLTTIKNTFSNKPDSTLHTINYQYNEENAISTILTINKHINSLGKNYTSTITAHHNYLNEGLIHEIKYFNNDKLSREQRLVRNTEGVLLEYTNRWVSPNRTTTFLYNSKGELTNYIAKRKNKILRNITLKYTYDNRGQWITCIHYNKKNKPEYLIERIVEYY